MHKRLVRCAAVREESPVRTPPTSRKTPPVTSSGDTPSMTSSGGNPSVTLSGGSPCVTSSGGIPSLTSSQETSSVTSLDSPLPPSPNSGQSTPSINLSVESENIPLDLDLEHDLERSQSEKSSAGKPDKVFKGNASVIARNSEPSPLSKDLNSPSRQKLSSLGKDLDSPGKTDKSRLFVDNSYELRRVSSHESVYTENKVPLRRTSSLRANPNAGTLSEIGQHDATLRRTASSSSSHENVYIHNKVPLRRSGSLEPRSSTNPKVCALRDLFAKPTKSNCDNPVLPVRKGITRKKAVTSLDVPSIDSCYGNSGSYGDHSGLHGNSKEGAVFERTVPPVSPTYKDRPAKLDITSHASYHGNVGFHGNSVHGNMRPHSGGTLVKQHCIEQGDTSRLAVKSDSFPERTPSGMFIHPEIARVRSLGDVPCSFTGNSGNHSNHSHSNSSAAASNGASAGTWSSRSSSNSPTGSNWNSSSPGSQGNTGHSNSHGCLATRSDSLRAITVHEEEVPVIVRRRGCTLRVRITSFTDELEDNYETYGGIQPIHVSTTLLFTLVTALVATTLP